MKFKFRPSTAKRKLKSPRAKRKSLRLRGINTLRHRKEVWLVRNYSAEDFGVFNEKAKKSSIFEFLKNLRKKVVSLARFFKEKLTRKRKKHATLSSATLFGALCAALSLTLISGSAVILSLFLRYAGAYTEVVIPDLTNLSVTEATEYSEELFEYRIIYEENPDKEPMSVISQSPQPNVTRKLFGRNEKIKMTLTVNQQPKSLSLPKLVGTRLRDNALSLKNAGINVLVIEEYSDIFPSGTVFFSSLSEGTELKAGDEVTVKVSLGKQIKYCSVPDLSGLSEYEASALLKAKGLAVGDIKYENSKKPVGTVTAQDSAANSKLPEGSKVSFTLSGGIYY